MQGHFHNSLTFHVAEEAPRRARGRQGKHEDPGHVRTCGRGLVFGREARLPDFGSKCLWWVNFRRSN